MDRQARPSGQRRPLQAAAAPRQPTTLAEARAAAGRAGEPSFRVPRPPRAAHAGAPPGPTYAATVRGPASAPSAHAGGDLGGGGPPPASGCQAAAEERPLRRGRWADETPPCDQMVSDDDGNSAYEDEDANEGTWDEQDEEDGADGDCGFGGVQPTPEMLRGRWLYESKVVKAIERAEWNHDGGPSAALQAAKAARDRAEEAWRGSLRPKPVALRMANAQRKLDRAAKAIEKAEAALQRHEEEAEAKRQRLQQALDAAEERGAARQRELDELHKEAGDIAAANATRGQSAATVMGGGGSAFRLHEAQAMDFQAFIESLDEGSEARSRANLLLAKWASAEEHPARQHFTIATDGEESEGAGAYQTVGRRGRPSRTPSSNRASASDVSAGRGAAGTTWSETAAGRWNRTRLGEPTDPQQPTTTGRTTEGNAAGAAGEQTQTPAATLGTPQSPAPQGRSNEAASAVVHSREAGRQSKGRQARDDTEAEQPPNKSHRGHDAVAHPASVESGADDATRARKLLEEQQAAMQAAIAAKATFGDEASMQIAGQLYAHKVELARQRAEAAGVPPFVDGKPLLQLSPESFNEWTANVLRPAEEAAEARQL